MSSTVIDLFSGLEGFSQAFSEDRDWEVVTVDFEERFSPDICGDVKKMGAKDLPDPDVVLASPPCKAFSVAAIGHYWKDGYIPKKEFVVESTALVHHTLFLIHQLDPEYWFLENPRGMLRNVIGEPEERGGGTVTWCQYGAERMKPTDLWGDHPESFRYRKCSNGDDCHASASRGSRTGTQGVDGSADRAKIPYGLSKAIKSAVENPEKVKEGMGEGNRLSDW